MDSEHSLLSIAGRLQNVLLVLTAVVAGLLFPTGATYIQQLTILIVGFLVYSSLVGVTVDRSYLTESLLSIVTILFISYGVVPFLGVTWAKVLLSEGSLLGVVAILSAPATAGSAIVWTRMANGNAKLSGIATLASIALAPVVMPILLSSLTSRSLTVPIQDLMFNLLAVILLGLLFLALVPSGVISERAMQYATMVSIALLIYAGVGTVGVSGMSFEIVGRLGLVALFVAMLGILCAYTAVQTLRIGKSDLSAILFSGTLKNLGIAFLIVLSTTSQEAVFAVIGYYVAQQVISALLIDGINTEIDALAPALP